MKKLGPKEICGAVAAIGVIACLLVYMLVFNKYTEMTDELKSSNKLLQIQVDDMKQYYDHMEEYKKSISDWKAVIEQVTADYPGDAREEDVIMMAVNMQGDAVVNFEKINIAATEPVYTVPEEMVKDLKDENLTTNIVFNAKESSYACNTDYANFKDAVKVVYDDKYRVGINSVSFKRDKDDNNIIKGDIDITYYSLQGMNKDYVKPDMPSYISGALGMDLFPPITVDGEQAYFTTVVE